MPTSSNFSFLAEHDPIFLRLVATAEQVFAADPNTTLIKLHQLAKQLGHEVVLDQTFVNRAFANDGGTKQLVGRLMHQPLASGMLSSVLQGRKTI